jgi:hypothetical protein
VIAELAGLLHFRRTTIKLKKWLVSGAGEITQGIRRGGWASIPRDAVQPTKSFRSG